MLPHKVDVVLSSVDSLRPIPSNIIRILKEIENPYTEVTKISEYIGLDQALTAMVIKTSNSALLGYEVRCNAITDAVMRIGLKRLKAILFALNSVGPMNGRLNGYRLGSGELWIHSLKIAMASEWLAKTLGFKDLEEAYVVGLLHDIGKLLLDQFVLQDYQQIVKYVNEYHMPLWQAENKLIGIDHAKLGGLMAERWNFPISLVEGIRYHHAPSEAKKDQKQPAIVNLANYLVHENEKGTAELLSNDLHPETYKILHLREEDLVRLSNGVNIALSTEIG
jgi:putative nucleotidyltransferase with HDIG domain